MALSVVIDHDLSAQSVISSNDIKLVCRIRNWSNEVTGRNDASDLSLSALIALVSNQLKSEFNLPLSI